MEAAAFAKAPKAIHLGETGFSRRFPEGSYIVVSSTTKYSRVTFNVSEKWQSHGYANDGWMATQRHDSLFCTKAC